MFCMPVADGSGSYDPEHDAGARCNASTDQGRSMRAGKTSLKPAAGDYDSAAAVGDPASFA